MIDSDLMEKKYIGALIGGAIGDALGYYVEFESEDYIFSKYGRDGITEFPQGKKGLISDDTQMTLFTACGVLNSYAMGLKSLEDISNCIYLSYLDWLSTQRYSFSSYKLSNNIANTFLVNYQDLFASRAPGMTCMRSLFSGVKGTTERPLNSSKGCGGVMRVAPIGLFYKETIDDVAMLGAMACAITHGHPLGFIPGAAYSHIINLLTHSDISIEEAVLDSNKMIKKLFGNYEETKYYLDLIDKAIKLSKTDTIPLDAIHMLGEGWVAEETLSISIYSALIAKDDFKKGVVISSNHNGDSDSTGSLTGAILGAKLGFDAIPLEYINNLELKDLIIDVGRDLYKTQIYDSLVNDTDFIEKYVLKTKGKI